LKKSEVRKRIKVGVLDTGVDLTHPEFREYIKNEQLDVGIDLVYKGQRMTDSDGHGTHVCHTLLKTAPYAKVYPIRFFEGRKGDDLSQSRVAEVLPCVLFS
jgi:subtilisin family serine protease